MQWWRRFGQDRPLHGTAHDALMAIPVFGRYFRSMGVLPAAPDAIATALAEGRDVALWPGGEVDSLRPWTERDRANLAGRKGFVKMAIRAGVPIVPIATVGGADAMPVLIRGDRLSRALRLDRLLRLKVFPLAISLPWGIAPAALPQLPLPAKIRTRFMPAVELDHDPARAEDDDYVDRKYHEVAGRHPGRHGRAGAQARIPALRVIACEMRAAWRLGSRDRVIARPDRAGRSSRADGVSVDSADDPFRLRWRGRHVADTADGVDHRIRVPGSELGAQPSHVNVDRTDAAVAVVAPHLVHQPGPRERLTGMLHKEVQQLELGERQAEVIAVQRRR